MNGIRGSFRIQMSPVNGRILRRSQFQEMGAEAQCRSRKTFLPVPRAAGPELPLDRLTHPNQNGGQTGAPADPGQGSGNSDVGTMIPTHAIDCDRDVHRGVRLVARSPARPNPPWS